MPIIMYFACNIHKTKLRPWSAVRIHIRRTRRTSNDERDMKTPACHDTITCTSVEGDDSATNLAPTYGRRQHDCLSDNNTSERQCEHEPDNRTQELRTRFERSSCPSPSDWLDLRSRHWRRTRRSTRHQGEGRNQSLAAALSLSASAQTLWRSEEFQHLHKHEGQRRRRQTTDDRRQTRDERRERREERRDRREERGETTVR
jgi:hypothetical protein